jgi:hypothetical protein
MRIIVAVLAVFLSALLAGCGGGGGDPATCGTMLHPNPCGATAGATGVAAMTLSLLDSSGTATTQISPDHTGTLKAVVTDGAGAAVANVAVTFTTSDSSGGFVPSSGTALTDSAGVAHVDLPSGKHAGGFTATASATVGSTTATGTAGYAVTFPSLALSALTITPATLSAGGNASISVAVSSGSAPYTPPLSVTFTSPCIAAGKATIGSPVTTQNGVATASYSDRGCGVADLISATAALGDSSVTQTGTITVLPATAGSIKFVSSDTTNISLRGTGGFGRQEFSTLTFEVSDTTGSKVAGTTVDFVFSDSNSAQTVGGLSLVPSVATSAADGTVTTLVTGGTIPTSVRVIATIHGSSPPIATLSNILVVSTGVPDQKHFSLATQTGNCEGRDIFQSCSFLTATLGDHFGNPVPDGTAVNFTTDGGVIAASCVTGSLPPAGATSVGQTTDSKVGPGSGACTVELRSGNPIPASGRVVVLAYAEGEEAFFDANGNNVCDGCDDTAGQEFNLSDDKSPDIFRDDDESGTWTAGEPCIGPVDANCNAPKDGQYDGVLRTPRVSSAQTLYVSSQLVQIFSGSKAIVTFNTADLVCPGAGTAQVQVRVTDEYGNIMPAGTTIEFSTLYGTFVGPVAPGSVTVNNVVLAVTQPREPMPIPIYTVNVGCGGAGTLTAVVTTPGHTKTFASLPIN